MFNSLQCTDEYNFSRDGIRHMNAREFLLSEEWR